ITVTAAASSKVYDGGTSSSSIPVITSGSLAYSDTKAFIETYDNKNVGTTHVMTPSGLVNDQNGGANYGVTFVTINTGIITKATPTVTVTGYTVVNDRLPHTATGTARGVQGEGLAGLDLSGTTHTKVGIYNDAWTFTDTTGNYFNAA